MTAPSPSFAARCGLHDAARAAACEALPRRLAELHVERVRVAWCDLHGALRSKTLLPSALHQALHDGVGFVSTLLLKDRSDETAYAVFEPGALEGLPGFGAANNVVLLPDPASLQLLPWAPGSAWMRAEPHFSDGRPVEIDPRRALQHALAVLAEAGFTLRCGLEVEFHIHRDVAGDRDGAADGSAGSDALRPLHAGRHLLGDAAADQAHEALGIVEHTVLGLGLPLQSLEVEMGPGQFEAVFAPADALACADWMVALRNGVRQALHRAGYHASFACRPPLAGAWASGWHLHQSLVLRGSGASAFCAAPDAPGSADGLSTTGMAWLAGLLAHGRAVSAIAAPSLHAYGRYKTGGMAPRTLRWGHDDRGAMLRVLGCGQATRIENRTGEPLANPYLCIAAQVHAGLDGLRRGLVPAPGDGAAHAEPLPASLADALDALAACGPLQRGFGAPLLRWYDTVKRFEIARLSRTGDDAVAADAAECFARF